MPERLTTSELAVRFGVKPQTVLSWYRWGWIPVVCNWSKPYLFDPVAVEEALRLRREMPPHLHRQHIAALAAS